MGVGDQRHAPATLYPRWRPGTPSVGGWVGPRAGLDICWKSRSHGFSITCDESLYRLSYNGPQKKTFFYVNNCLNYDFFKIVHLCNCTLLPSTENVLATFLKTIMCKPVHLFLRILHDVISFRKAPSLQCCFQCREEVKISYSRVRECGEYFSAVALFVAMKSPWSKPNGLLEHYSKK